MWEIWPPWCCYAMRKPRSWVLATAPSELPTSSHHQPLDVRVKALPDDPSPQLSSHHPTPPCPNLCIFPIKAPDVLEQRQAMPIGPCQNFQHKESRSITTLLFHATKLWSNCCVAIVTETSSCSIYLWEQPMSPSLSLITSSYFSVNCVVMLVAILWRLHRLISFSDVCPLDWQT